MDKNNKGNFETKKSLGQCFLTDPFIIDRIISETAATKENTVFEIGPGAGAITKGLLKTASKVVAFEIDKDVIPVLKENCIGLGDLEIIETDILKADLTIIEKYQNPILVSNLPYYITSPIISLFFEKMPTVNRAVFMMQKEVGDRITAPVNTKDYNAFSIIVQYLAESKKLINVSRKSFNPSPNVDSVVIELKKRERSLKASDYSFFKKIVYDSFKERRKTLVNNLSQSLNISKDILKEILLDMELNESIRSEALTIDEFVELSERLKEIIKK